MKNIWKLIAIAIATGLVLSIIGISMGASRTLYLSNTGIHIAGGGESRITELDLGYFNSIFIDASFSDVEFVAADKYGVDIRGYDMEWHWTLEGEILTISHERRSRIQILNFGLSSNSNRSYVKVYLPRDAELENVAIKSGSGNVKLGNFRADSVEITNSFGDVELYNAKSDHLMIDMNSVNFTGSNINVQSLFYNNRFGNGRFQTVSAERFTAESNSGDLELTGCVFGEISITSSFGKITANDIVSSRADIQANSGDISLNGDFTGETIIQSNFGNVKLSTSGEKEEYSYDISAKFGRITLDGERLENDTSIKSRSLSENSLNITVSSGDIEVYFSR
jgi:DUF4097 and DUF4098 domain-containing protein YvlB